MIRDIDLVSYLPPFVAEYKETNIALTAESPEFVFIWKAADRALKNEFIATADEYGISRFEKLLGICPDASETLENRRARVQSRWCNAPPYTVRTLRYKLGELLGGEHNFSINSDFQNTYTLCLLVFSLDDSRIAELKHLLSAMVPSNVITDIIYEDVHKGTVCFGGAMQEADIIELRQR